MGKFTAAASYRQPCDGPAIGKRDDHMACRDSHELAEHGVEIVEMLENIGADNQVEAVVVKRESLQRFQVQPDVGRALYVDPAYSRSGKRRCRKDSSHPTSSTRPAMISA